MEQDLPSMCSFSIIILALESHYFLNLFIRIIIFFFLNFTGIVGTEEEDQVGLQAPEDPHDSSTDSCLTFPYSSDSPRPFPPSPMHPVTDSPIRVSLLFIATSNPPSDNSAIYRSIDHNSPTPVLSTPPISMPSQTFTSILPAPTTNSSINPFYTPYFSSSFPHTGPIVFPGGPPEFTYFEAPLSGSSSTFPNTISLPSYSIPSFSTGPQSMSSPRLYRRRGRSSRGTYSGRGRTSRGRRGMTTSTTSCQTSPIPSYFWPISQV